MGHQISCYLSVRDSVLLTERVLHPNKEVLLSDRSRRPFPKALDSTDWVENGQRWYFFYLARCADPESILMLDVPNQGYWCIDDLYSPVIEFTLGRLDGDVLRSGRLYYKDSYYDGNDKLAYKSSPFVKWASD